MIVPYQFQQEVLNKSRDKREFAWFLETGTGKTVISLENMRYLWQEKKIKAVIISAPKTVLKSVWIKELDNYPEINYRVFSWIGELSQSDRNLLSQILRVNDSPFAQLWIFLINTEAFSHKRVLPLVNAVLRKWYTLWIMDQSTMIKSPNALRTKNVLSLSHLAEYKRILSGFPVLKSPEDLYTQIQFLGPQLIPQKSFYGFRGEFCILRQLDNRVSIAVGIQNIPQLQKLIEPFSIRMLKKDCLDLPEKVRMLRMVEMTKEQKKHYNEIKEQGFTTLQNTEQKVFTTTLLAQLVKLHQIANGIIGPGIAIDNPKGNIIVDLLLEELADEQVIIWSCYVDSIVQLVLLLHEKGITARTLYGETSTNDRATYVDGFNNREFQVLIANPAVAKFGLNLTVSSYAIYSNNSLKLEDRLESEDRIHRLGQTRHATYIDLIAEDTLEHKLLDMLDKKQIVGSTVLGDEWKSWFK